MKPLFNHQQKKKPFVIAGPCLAENFELMDQVARSLSNLSLELDFNYIFKASFDKANRSSIESKRGQGWEKTKDWFIKIKEKYHVPILTDIHESYQAKQVATVCDIIQIPAFLCRQTDLIVSACKTGKMVNIKKGQFLAPKSTHSIVKKVEKEQLLKTSCILTERGTSFGYGDLIVDMRSFKTMSETGAYVCFDMTHSLQLPASQGKNQEESSGQREFASALARAAIATSYVDGVFLEVHTTPDKAHSDKKTQLNITQAKNLLTQIIPLWYSVQSYRESDHLFK